MIPPSRQLPGPYARRRRSILPFLLVIAFVVFAYQKWGPTLLNSFRSLSVEASIPREVVLSQAQHEDDLVQQADVLICAANRPSAWLTAERKAKEFGRPIFAAGLEDGRVALGGIVRWNLPEHSSKLACAACGIRPDTPVPQGEGLVMPVIQTAAAHVTNLVVQYVAGLNRDFLFRNNFLAFDAEGPRAGPKCVAVISTPGGKPMAIPVIAPVIPPLRPVRTPSITSTSPRNARRYVDVFRFW